MSHYQLRIKQFLKTDIDTIWDFASSPANLKEITPDYMLFNITSKNLPEKMYPGMIIAYEVSPILNIKMNWLTEITQVKDKSFLLMNNEWDLTRCGIISTFLKNKMKVS